MNEQKRKNFGQDEKNQIFSIIAKHKGVIECKKTDAVSTQEKNKAWESIAEEYNCSSGASQRTVTQLKSFYKNAKSNLKKNIAANRASIFRTGGGSQEHHLDENDTLLSIVVPQTFSIENSFDSSSELFNLNENEIVSTDTNEVRMVIIFVYFFK